MVDVVFVGGCVLLSVCQVVCVCVRVLFIVWALRFVVCCLLFVMCCWPFGVCLVLSDGCWLVLLIGV